MNLFKNIFLSVIVVGALAACQPADKIIEKNFENADTPVPNIIEPVAKPVAEPVMDTADEVLKERTLRDTRQKGKKGGYKATLFPKSESKSDDGTAFKLSW